MLGRFDAAPWSCARRRLLVGICYLTGRVFGAAEYVVAGRSHALEAGSRRTRCEVGLRLVS
jgi:hypothetical protein